MAAVLVNAGNANCATGQAGIDACVRDVRRGGGEFGCIFDEVIPFLDRDYRRAVSGGEGAGRAAGGARPRWASTPAHAEMFAQAIMTTDTRMKSGAGGDRCGRRARCGCLGAAKGAGMIHPQLGAPVGPPHATMLVYLFTDVEATRAEICGLCWQPAVERSFNAISIDGDTSTNDTVLLLASGASGVTLSERVRAAFEDALTLVCGWLAHQIVDDGEGVGHVVTLHVAGAETEAEAKQVARAIAHSALCKTAWSSADPNWGRLLAAAGRSGVAVRARPDDRLGRRPSGVCAWSAGGGV